MVTGASLYFAPLSTFVAHRHTVKTIHVYAGSAAAGPAAARAAVPGGRQLRRDLSRINRWTADDRRWWSRRSRAKVQLGKFNPGQKLNAVFVGAAIVLMLATGSIMRWFEPFPDSIRTGATFVHDWTFIALVVVIVGHIMFALSDFDSLRSMVRGWVPEQWARRGAAALVGRGGRGAAPAESGTDAGGDVEAGGDERIGEPRVGAGEMPVGD